jgi:hypothetical protein
VLELDETFYNGGAHLALGLMAVALPPALGGQPAEGKAHFERALAITKGKFLMIQVMYASRYGVATGDEKFFHDELVEVLNTSPAIWPEERLANELAYARAKRYLAHEKELF